MAGSAPRSGAELLERWSDPRLTVHRRRALLQQVGRVHGNRHVSRLIAAHSASPGTIQRRSLGSSTRRPLASITFSSPGYVTTEATINGEEELIPEGENAATFAGFDQRLLAYGQAWRNHSRICAIITDREGKYHVIKTDFPGRGVLEHLTIVPFQNDFASLTWVNKPRVAFEANHEAVAVSWSQRVTRASGWRDMWKLHSVPASFSCPHEGRHGTGQVGLDQFRRCIENEYASLLAGTLDVPNGQVSIIGAAGPTNPGALVSFDLTLDDKAKGGITRLPTDRTSEVPESGITFGPDAFYRESDIQLLGTAVHESTHVEHAELAIDWLERWRASSTRSDFPTWLEAQKRRRRLTLEQFDLIIEETQSGDSPSTETLAHLEGFMATYHHLPMDETIHRWEQIDKGAGFWAHAGHEINDTSVSRLASYYSGLEPARQADFAAHARMRLGAAMPHVLFWQRVVRDVLGGR